MKPIGLGKDSRAEAAEGAERAKGALRGGGTRGHDDAPEKVEESTFRSTA
jgi:hypothetical protein